MSKLIDIEQRIDYRLRELADHERLVAGNLSELQSGLTRLGGAQERVAQSMLNNANTVNGLVKDAQKLHDAIGEQARGESDRLEQFRVWQGQIQERQAESTNQISNLINKTQEAQVRMLQAFSSALNTLQVVLKKNADEVERASQAWAGQQSAMRADLGEMVQAHRVIVEQESEVVGRIEAALGRLPGRNLQATVLITGVIQVFLLGACVYGLLAR